MANTYEKKHYLDQVGLELVWAKIKALVAKSTTTVVGTADEVKVTAGAATTTGTTYTVGLEAKAKASLEKADTALQIGDVTPVANATVTLGADGKGTATTVATIGTGDAAKTIAVNVDASAIAGAAEKLDNSGSATNDYVDVTVTAKTSATATDGKFGTVGVTVDATKLKSALDAKVAKSDVKLTVPGDEGEVDATAATVDNWGESASLSVDGKKLTVTLPANPIADITGGTDSDKGIEVAIDPITLAPEVTVTPGEVATGDTSVVTGGAVYTAIEDAKAEDKYVSTGETGQAITSTGGLISGTLAITSDKNGGSATLSVNPTLTKSTKTATAIATKEYVDEKATAEKVEYTFGADAKFSKVTDKEEYTVTVPLMKSVGGAAATQADAIVLTLDSSEFVKDSFLQKAEMGTGDKVNTLILTMKLADGTTKDIEVDLSKFIDTYTEGNGISIGDRVISVKTTTGGYLKADENGLNIDSDQIAKGTSTGASATNLATKGYVDDAIATNVEAITETEINTICV